METKNLLKEFNVLCEGYSVIVTKINPENNEIEKIIKEKFFDNINSSYIEYDNYLNEFINEDNIHIKIVDMNDFNIIKEYYSSDKI